MGCLNEQEFEVVERMSKYGGSFVKALADCFHHADRMNKRILKEAFAHYWKEYENFEQSKWDSNLAEQADQDYKESQFTGDAFLQ